MCPSGESPHDEEASQGQPTSSSASSSKQLTYSGKVSNLHSSTNIAFCELPETLGTFGKPSNVDLKYVKVKADSGGELSKSATVPSLSNGGQSHKPHWGFPGWHWGFHRHHTNSNKYSISNTAQGSPVQRKQNNHKTIPDCGGSFLFTNVLAMVGLPPPPHLLLLMVLRHASVFICAAFINGPSPLLTVELLPHH
jgi:hypothetical protein